LHSSPFRLPLTIPLFPYTTLFRSPTEQKAPALHVMELRGYRGWRVILTEEAVTLQSLRPRYRQAWTPGVQPAAVHTAAHADPWRSEEHTSELQSRENLVCRLLLEK